MRILVLNYEYPPIGGGGGVITEQLATELAKRHDVAVITSGCMGLPRHERRDGVDVYRLPVFGRRSKSVASLPSMAVFLLRARVVGSRIAARFRPDVIHTWFVLPTGPVGTWLARRTGAPNLLTIVGGDIYDPSKRISPHRWAVLRHMVRRTARAADRVVAISSDVRSRARQHYGLDEDDIGVVPLGFVEPTFAPCDRSALGLPSDAFVLVTIGRLIRRKANDRLLDAMSLIDDPSVMLVIVGEGPEQAALEDRAERLGIQSRVVFAGAVREETKFQLLSVADAYAMASLHEGFGIVFMEAMHCGLPVITNLMGGQRDFLVPGENALIAEHNTAEEIAEAITALRGDASLRRRLSEGGRKCVQELGIDRMADTYERMFGEIAASPAKAAYQPPAHTEPSAETLQGRSGR